MEKLKDIMVIANPESGKSDADDFEDFIRVKLSDYFNWVEVKFTEDAGHATELAIEACEEGYDSICSVGGDGTLAEILQGMIKFDNPPKLLIFPAGTGNILSQSLGYTQNKKRVIDQIDFTNAKNIDLGLIDGKVFSFLLSIGNIPESVHDVSNEEKEKFGMMAYVSNVMKNINKERQYNLKVEMDGEVFEGNVDHLAVTVSEKFGPIKISNLDAKADDGLMNVFILKDKSIISKAKFGIDTVFGDIRNNNAVKYMQGKKLKISNLDQEDVYIDLDGDKGPKLPVEVSVVTDKIRVYMPKKNNKVIDKIKEVIE